jgi:large subunit ribosomal protein L24
MSVSHVRRGDLVVVMKGKDRGKRGKVLRVKGDRVIVEKEGTIAIANVLLWDEKLGRGVRTKVATDGGQKIRVGTKSGTKFPNPGL